MSGIQTVVVALATFVITAFVTAGAESATLERLRDAAVGVRTIVSDFEQEQRLELLEHTIVTRGRLFIEKPDRLRWEVTAPERSGFLVAGRAGSRWNERRGSHETFDLGSEPALKAMAEQILSWAAGDFDRLAKHFWLSVLKESPPTLRLDPRSATGGIERITIVYTDDATSVRSVMLDGANGDYTRIQFKNTEINGDIPPGAFTPPPLRE